MKPIKRIPRINKRELGEYYTLLLLVVGLPVIGLIYVNWELAVALTIIIQTVIGVLYFGKDR